MNSREYSADLMYHAKEIMSVSAGSSQWNFFFYFHYFSLFRHGATEIFL
jgi:hypothetical protein